MEKKNRFIIGISMLAIAIVLIAVTYAYFSDNITGTESESTIVVTGEQCQ